MNPVNIINFFKWLKHLQNEKLILNPILHFSKRLKNIL